MNGKSCSWFYENLGPIKVWYLPILHGKILLMWGAYLIWNFLPPQEVVQTFQTLGPSCKGFTLIELHFNFFGVGV